MLAYSRVLVVGMLNSLVDLYVIPIVGQDFLIPAIDLYAFNNYLTGNYNPMTPSYIPVSCKWIYHGASGAKLATFKVVI